MIKSALRNIQEDYQWPPSSTDIGHRFCRATSERIAWPRPLTSTPTTTEMRKWVEPTLARMEELASLGDNWDGRGSAEVRVDALSFAFSVLAQIMPPTAPAPAVVPLGHGGVQLLWHNQAHDLEVEIVGPNEIISYHLDRNTGIEDERPLTTELSPLARLLWSSFRT
jgi:hypothetical protein